MCVCSEVPTVPQVKLVAMLAKLGPNVTIGHVPVQHSPPRAPRCFFHLEPRQVIQPCILGQSTSEASLAA